MVLTVRSKDLAGNRSALYEPLVKELLALEEGIEVKDGLLKAGLVIHEGDNLEAMIHILLFTSSKC